MFNNSKYTTWYHFIVSKAIEKNRVKGKEYFESHHILPKSLGGTNCKNNLVLLTAREHYICHWLLLKMVDDDISKRSMFFAFMKMRRSSTNHNNRYTSKHYNTTKRLYSVIMSGSNNHCYGRRGNLHPLYGKVGNRKGIKHTNEHRAYLSEIQKGKPKHSESFKRHMKNLFKGVPKTIEARKKMSLSHIGKNKGKTYEEMYGAEKAAELKALRAENMRYLRSKQKEQLLT